MGIYLDNSMATRPSPKSISKMIPFFQEKWGHPSQPHRKGQELYPALNESVRNIQELLGAKPTDRFIFTSSGAEAVNHVIASAYENITLQTGRNHYLAANTNEAPSLMAIGRLEQSQCVGKMIPVNSQGKITEKLLGDVITPRTALLSLDWANGLTGVIQPIAEIASLCDERGIALHLDATHVLGKLYFDLEDLGASYITFNGDQLHAPKGTGGLWIKEGAAIAPWILGGIEQNGLRGGSFNVAGLVALGAAAVELIDTRDLLSIETARLRNRLEEGLLKEIPGAVIHFKEEERVPHIAAIGFPGVANEALLFALNKQGVYASIGGGSFQQLGLILAASGVPEPLAHSSISFSLSRETTDEEIEQAIPILAAAVHKLRKISLGILPPEQK